MVLWWQLWPRRKTTLQRQSRDGSRHGLRADTLKRTKQLRDYTIGSRHILGCGIPLVGAVFWRPRHGWESGKYRRGVRQKHYQLSMEQSGAADEVVEGAQRHSWDRRQNTVHIAAGSDDLGGSYDEDSDLVGGLGDCRGDTVDHGALAVGIGSHHGANCYAEVLENRADDADVRPMTDEAADRG